jgi:hypothetical protein
MMQDSINLFRDWQRGGANIFLPEDQRQNYGANTNLRNLYGGKQPWMQDEELFPRRNQ